MPINYIDNSSNTRTGDGNHYVDHGGTSTAGYGHSHGDPGQRWEISPKTGYAGQPLETPQEMLQQLYDRANGMDAPRGHNDDQEGDRQTQDNPGAEPGNQEGVAILLDNHHETELRKIGSSVPSADIYEGLSYLSKGEDVPAHVIGAVASNMGIEPGEAAETINTLRGQFESQAIEAVSGYGVNPFDIFDWARDNMPQDLQRAINDHTHQRTVSGYKGIAQEYMLNLDKTDPNAIINADFGDGISARLSNGPGSTLVLSTPAGDVSWQTAVRLGYIKVSRNG